MRTEKNILIAFILNLAFSIFEFAGGILTGSVAIMSDAVHDVGDAASIGISFFLEKKSKLPPDEKYNYGYARFSVLGGLITTLILLVGSIAVIAGAAARLANPVPVNYDGMIVFAVVGVMVNAGAAFITREGKSINQKAVNLHMLEDVLGWAVVLIGAVIMRFTDISIIDSLMSIGISLFIITSALKNLKDMLNLFLVKTPDGICTEIMREKLCELEGVIDIHHIHVWSTDDVSMYATMHVVTDRNFHDVKKAVRKELKEQGICHVTLELEEPGEHCHEKECRVEHNEDSCGHNHHHHHHHHHH